jgi:putative Ca2+/H+ antiporter (TMEM165/GDT1 family)
MDWKLFFTVFFSIFLAEIGDKTQLAALAYSAQSNKTMVVGAGVVLGLCAAGVIGVLAGKWLGTMVSPKLISTLSGLLFIGIGIWMLIASRTIVD